MIIGSMSPEQKGRKCPFMHWSTLVGDFDWNLLDSATDHVERGRVLDIEGMLVCS